MNTIGQNCLGIFWDGTEVPGVIFYGLRKPHQVVKTQFPASVWDHLAKHRQSMMHGDNWQVVIWDVQIDRWPKPEYFAKCVKKTLEALQEANCVVAWLGLDGFFVDPPSLFLPQYMSGGILAALSERGFEMPFALDKPLVSLSDEALLSLRDASKGLASSN